MFANKNFQLKFPKLEISCLTDEEIQHYNSKNKSKLTADVIQDSKIEGINSPKLPLTKKKKRNVSSHSSKNYQKHLRSQTSSKITNRRINVSDDSNTHKDKIEPLCQFPNIPSDKTKSKLKNCKIILNKLKRDEQNMTTSPLNQPLIRKKNNLLKSKVLHTKTKKNLIVNKAKKTQEVLKLTGRANVRDNYVIQKETSNNIKNNHTSQSNTETDKEVSHGSYKEFGKGLKSFTSFKHVKMNATNKTKLCDVTQFRKSTFGGNLKFEMSKECNDEKKVLKSGKLDSEMKILREFKLDSDIEILKECKLDSEIKILKECKNVWCKIEREEPLCKNNRNGKQLDRSELINSLINENKILTIPIPPPVLKKPLLKTLTQESQMIEDERKDNINCRPLKTEIRDELDVEKYNSEVIGGNNVSETNSLFSNEQVVQEKRIETGNEDLDNHRYCTKETNASKIKVITTQALGINESTQKVTNIDQDDSWIRLMKSDLVKGENGSITAEICLLYFKYFNFNLAPLLTSLNTTLHLALRELKDCTSQSININHDLDIILSSEQAVTTLVKYSKKFVATFKDIQNTFEETHRSKMTPIVYLHLMNSFEGTDGMKVVKSIISKMFQIESIKNQYDRICCSSDIEARDILSIYERWLGKFVTRTSEIEVLSKNNTTASILNNGLDITGNIKRRDQVHGKIADNPNSVVGGCDVSDSRDHLCSSLNQLDGCGVENHTKDVIEVKFKDKNITEKDFTLPVVIDPPDSQRFASSDSSHNDIKLMIGEGNVCQTEGVILLEEKRDEEMDDRPPLVIDLSDNQNDDACDKLSKKTKHFKMKDIHTEAVQEIVSKELKTALSNSKSELVKSKFPSSSDANHNQLSDGSNSEETLKIQKQKHHIYEYQEGLSTLDCPLCRGKMVAPCYYCKEPVCCENMCQVKSDQVVESIESEHHILTLISCEQHKNIRRKTVYDQNFDVIEDHEMPYDPVCWRSGCSQRANIICVCKTRAYCSLSCGEADWYCCHHQHCSCYVNTSLLHQHSHNNVST